MPTTFTSSSPSTPTTHPTDDLTNDATIERMVRVKARSLVAHPCFNEHDVDDIAQELWLHILVIAPQHCSERGQRSTFFERALTNRVNQLIRHRTARCRDPKRISQPADINDDEFTLDHLAGDDAASADDYWSDPDLVDVLGQLTERQQHICMRLGSQTKVSLADDLGITRWQLETELTHIRTALRGFRPERHAASPAGS